MADVHAPAGFAFPTEDRFSDAPDFPFSSESSPDDKVNHEKVSITLYPANGADNSPRSRPQPSGLFHDAVQAAFLDAQNALNKAMQIALIDAQNAIEAAKAKVYQAHSQTVGITTGCTAVHSHSPQRPLAVPSTYASGCEGDSRVRSRSPFQSLVDGLAAVAAEEYVDDGRTNFFAKMVPTAARWRPPPMDGPTRKGSKDAAQGAGRDPSKGAATGWRTASKEVGGRMAVQQGVLLQPRHSLHRRHQEPCSILRRSWRQQEGFAAARAAYARQNSLRDSSASLQRSSSSGGNQFTLSAALAKQASMRSNESLRRSNSPGLERQTSIQSLVVKSSSLKSSRRAASASLRVQLQASPPQPPAATASPRLEPEDSPRAAGVVHLLARATTSPALPPEDPPPPPPPASAPMRHRARQPSAESMESSKSLTQEPDSAKLVCAVTSGKSVEDRVLTAGHSQGLSSKFGNLRQSTSEGCMRRSSTSKLVNVVEGAKHMDVRLSDEGKKSKRVCSSSWDYALDLIVGLAIVLNCVSIGVSADTQDWAAWPFIDMVFASVFSIEMLVNMRFGVMSYFFGRCFMWNWFDFVLVVVAWVEIGMTLSKNVEDATGLSALRILRMTRVARVLRVCKLSVFGDLSDMINGAIGGMRTFLWSQVILAIPLYVVALLLRDSLGDGPHNRRLTTDGHAEVSSGEYAAVSSGDHAGVAHADSPLSHHFDSVLSSYFTSFGCFVAGECLTEKGEPIFLIIHKEYGWFFAFLHMFVTVIFVFALFNVIVAIFVENTLAAAKANAWHQKQTRLTDPTLFHRKAIALVDLIYEYEMPNQEFNWDAPDLQALMEEAMKVQLSREVFDELVQLERFQKILQDLDVNVAEQLDLFDTLDVDGGGTIDLEELLTGIHRLRGDARRSDIVGAALRVNSIQEYLLNFEAEVLQQFGVVRAALNVPEDAGVGSIATFSPTLVATTTSTFGFAPQG